MHRYTTLSLWGYFSSEHDPRRDAAKCSEIKLFIDNLIKNESKGQVIFLSCAWSFSMLAPHYVMDTHWAKTLLSDDGLPVLDDVVGSFALRGLRFFRRSLVFSSLLHSCIWGFYTMLPFHSPSFEGNMHGIPNNTCNSFGLIISDIN